MNPSEFSRKTAPGSRNPRAAAEMVAAAFAFATMACIAHGFRGQIAWPVVAFTRIAITMVLAHIMLRLYGAPLMIRGTKALWCRSVFGSCGLLCSFYCFMALPVTDAVAVLATSPIWVTVIMTVVFKERTSPVIWFYVAVAVAGVYIMQRPTFDAESFPLAVAVGGAFLIAIAKVSLSRCAELPVLSVVVHATTWASLASLALCFIVVDRVVLADVLPAKVWLWLVPMGLAGTVGQLLMTTAFGHGRATLVALVGISQIAFTAFYDVAVWGETFDALKIVGVLMIVSSIAMTVTATGKTAEKPGRTKDGQMDLRRAYEGD